MNKNHNYLSVGIIFILVVAIILVFNIIDDSSFMGLSPKAVYKQYKIYDVIEQKGLACAEVIEILDSDDTYDYYFDCLRSDKIYFVSDAEILKVKEVYERRIITKEELYELGIVDRMVKIND